MTQYFIFINNYQFNVTNKIKGNERMINLIKRNKKRTCQEESVSTAPKQ